jgi:hypothetical protein
MPSHSSLCPAKILTRDLRNGHLAILSHKDEKVYKNALEGRALRLWSRSGDRFAPFLHLHSHQESRTMIPDHAELCAQEMHENAGGNGTYEAAPGMI